MRTLSHLPTMATALQWPAVFLQIDDIRILQVGIGLELVYNGGSCGGISLKRDGSHLHLKRLPA